MEKSEQIILGVDPGTSILGYGLIHNKGNKIELINMGVINLTKYDNHYIKLRVIFERMKGLIDEYHPDIMSIEAPFFGKNVQSMLKLGRAQGVCMAAAVYRDIHIVEYSPKKIKKSITGNGNASKEQVAMMLKTTVNLMVEAEFLDATDALAAAVCHSYQNENLGGDKSYSGWGAYAKKNPGRIK